VLYYAAQLGIALSVVDSKAAYLAAAAADGCKLQQRQELTSNNGRISPSGNGGRCLAAQ